MNQAARGVKKEGRWHPIRVAAARAGLTPHRIRQWERRYELVSPNRDGSGHRLYSHEDIVRLRLLGRAVEAGRRISDVVSLNNAELNRMVQADAKESGRSLACHHCQS